MKRLLLLLLLLVAVAGCSQSPSADGGHTTPAMVTHLTQAVGAKTTVLHISASW